VRGSVENQLGPVMLKKFLTDPNFLLRYYFYSVMIFAVAVGVLWGQVPLSIEGLSWLWLLLIVPLAMGGLANILITAVLYVTLFLSGHDQSFSYWYLAMVPVGVLFGLYALALVHWAGHGVFAKRLNRIVGEIVSVPLLVGYPGWCVIHALHHKHADDLELDPHPTGERTVLQFGRFMKKAMIERMGILYQKRYDGCAHTRGKWQATKFLLVLNRLLRATFILVVLGPAGFVFFYLPAFVAQTAFFIHFNWATHRSIGNGQYQVINIDRGLYYRTMNLLLLGAYYHKNHHLMPGLLDPRILDK
jgi:fatty acid desaturase